MYYGLVIQNTENIKDFDGHYAITKDNTLIDLFHDKGENISDVKDWSERKSGHLC